MVRVGLIALAALYLSSCSVHPVIPDEMAGRWTPRSVSNCGPEGKTIEFSNDGLFFTDGEVRTKIMQIVDVRTDQPATFDMMYRLRDLEKAGEHYGELNGLRFKMDDAAHIRLIGSSKGKKAFFPVTSPSDIIERFNLQKCS